VVGTRTLFWTQELPVVVAVEVIPKFMVIFIGGGWFAPGSVFLCIIILQEGVIKFRCVGRVGVDEIRRHEP
jgi:hypothetical protein